MKKIKLITPLTFCVLSTITMPLASCGGEKPEPGFIYWTKGQTYEPLTPMDSKEYDSCQLATRGYHDKAIELTSEKIISDDFVYKVSKGLLSRTDLNISFDVEKIGYKLTDIGDIEYTGGEMFFRVSFQIRLTATALATTIKETQSEIKYKNAKIEFLNMPLRCSFTTSDPHILITSCYEGGFEYDSKWSIKMPKLSYDKINDVVSISTNEAKYDKDSITELKEESLYDIVSSFATSFVEFHSNYFLNVTVKNPE